jgi:hypothetical protein
MKTAEYDGASIVMTGSFNPSIFQPRWLGSQQLIRTEEAENAKITTIQGELADFSTEWFHLQVLQNRFQISSQDPRQYAPLRDLAGAMFAILPHTPVTALGLSRHFHFRMPSMDSWHGLGHLLAPKDYWNSIMEKPGLRSMVIEGRRKQADGGLLFIKVEPSLRVEYGVYVEFHEEFKAPGDSESGGSPWVPDRLAEHWDVIMKYSENAAEYIVSLVKD